ncbi:MAG: TolB family protein [Ignavibacteriaceae bacterium]
MARIYLRFLDCWNKEFLIHVLSLFFILSTITNAQSKWSEMESDHFKVIYKDSYSYLASHILLSAENALKPLMKIFNYKPSEKIVIIAYDFTDYGFGAATTVPQNVIQLEIEPFEPGYENVLYTERIQWTLSHELVHIVVNDKTSNAEDFLRSIFGKVAPEQIEPLTIFYSLLTNYNRYTPRWHQESIAVFFETWFNGGFGRILGSFDEMYFRTLTVEGKNFPSAAELENLSNTSYLLGTIYYLYGTRFAAYLALQYGPEKLISWFNTESSDFYESYTNKFNKTFRIGFDKTWDEFFGTNFYTEWKNFISYEEKFQEKNLEKLKSAPVTSVRKITQEPFGWVTQPFLNTHDGNIYFGYNKPGQLASLQKLNIKNSESEDISTLPTPSLLQVSSLAYDDSLELLFYTTNNNELYRNIWAIDLKTGDQKELFKDYRTGDITVSPVTHELWGIQHDAGKVSLMYSAYPYKKMEPIINFGAEDNLFNLSVSPSGKYLAAVLHRASGEQSIILVNCDNLKSTGKFQFETLSDKGSPENPSWSHDEKFLYWDAYTNGVSNIYRDNLETSSIEALSNTLTGLFRPIYLNADSLFAFEFSTDGFIPVIIPNKPAEELPAINYFGEQILNHYPSLANYVLKPAEQSVDTTGLTKEEDYSGLSNLKIQTFVPVISGFQSEKVIGFYTHIADPIFYHDLTMEFGYSPFKDNSGLPKFHFRGKYEFKKEFEVGLDYNASDFYDLFNDRKRGMIGTKVTLADTYYWVYDNPLKVKQKTQIDYYGGIKSINDNLIKVSQADFVVAQTNLNSKNLRRSIGSVDYEEGNEFNFTALGFGANSKKLQLAGEAYGEWDNYSIFIFPHNVFHLKFAAGYVQKNDSLDQAHFYFGGFGNRPLENVSVKQYRDVFRFPGIPIYSLLNNSFAKILVEENFPPLRFDDVRIGEHFLNYIDMSIYSENLFAKPDQVKTWSDAGGQINLVFKHWFNLESTLSAGIAKAWYGKENSWDWFLSFKLLQNLF